ncbi:MAG: TlpA family protein disulfide reductase [Prevotellaceae bacterium]|jgi:thiol-disulfide isomerase/thioredoxin|nr:TlpA family protein disulfide reductase [Prevotellaceae bacterium]
MKRVFYLIFGSILFFACLQEKDRLEPKRTVIAGIVNNFPDNASVLVINYCNPLSDEYRFAQNLTESNGYFRTEHEYVFAQNLTIRFANRFINLFVHPGDSIFISIDANEIERNFDNAVTFSNDNSKLNKELFIWTNYWYNSLNKHTTQFDDNADPEDLLISVKQNFDKAQDSIQIYSQRTNMSDFLKKWAYIDHKFIMANSLIDYNNPEADKWDIFTNPVFDVFNENNFQSMYFCYHLSVCMNALIQGDVEITSLFSDKEYVPAIRLTIESLLKKAPEGVARDVMLFGFLKNKLKEMPELYDAIPEIKTAFSQELFYIKLGEIVDGIRKTEQIQQLYETETQSSNILFLADNNKIENLPKVKLLKFLTEKHRNKVLYIDVWATWCGPCIKEFEAAPSLHKYFKDKDVIFINLCMGSNFKNWQSAITKNNIGGENYFLDDNASQLFSAEHNLGGYPFYIVIGKTGEIYNHAPRPSNLEAVIQKIESCL